MSDYLEDLELEDLPKENTNKDAFLRQPPFLGVVRNSHQLIFSTSLCEDMMLNRGDMINILQSRINKFMFYLYKTNNKDKGIVIYRTGNSKICKTSNSGLVRKLGETFRFSKDSTKTWRLKVGIANPIKTKLDGEDVLFYQIYDTPTERNDLTVAERDEYIKEMKESFEMMNDIIKAKKQKNVK